MLSIGKGGRPAGAVSAQTKRKQLGAKRIIDRVYKMTDKLIDAQAIVALGSHKMLRTFVGEDGMPHVETIRDEERMQKLIDEGVYGKDYVIVVGAMPDHRAVTALLDRVYGKPKETIELQGEVKFSLKGLAERRAQVEAPQIAEAEIIDVIPKE